jgi:hypothetical protein
VLSNTPWLQAVYDKSLKIVEIAFRIPAKLDTAIGQIGVDQACLLIVQKIGSGWKVTASNPKNQPMLLHVDIDRGSETMRLPEGNLAGSSVSVTMRAADRVK